MPLLETVIDANFTNLEVYCEPFAGGAGAATALLGSNKVQSILLNDADTRIHSVWHSILNETEEFVERIMKTPLTMHSWWKMKEVIEQPSNYKSLEIGFSTFFLNRTNRSGIVTGAGPIGGYDQSGKWLIDARFNRESLARRVQFLASQKTRITITNLDALGLLTRENLLPVSSFTFLDPPYVRAGSRLYFNSMDESRHRALQAAVRTWDRKWLMTYDDNSLIREIYSDLIVHELPIRYALQVKRLEKEMLIKSVHTHVP